MNLKILTLEETNTVKEALNLHASMLLGDCSGIKVFPLSYWGREFTPSALLEFELELQKMSAKFQHTYRQRQQAEIAKKLQYLFTESRDLPTPSVIISKKLLTPSKREVLSNALTIFNAFAFESFGSIAEQVKIIWDNPDPVFVSSLKSSLRRLAIITYKYERVDPLRLHGVHSLITNHHDLLM